MPLVFLPCVIKNIIDVTIVILCSALVICGLLYGIAMENYLIIKKYIRLRTDTYKEKTVEKVEKKLKEFVNEINLTLKNNEKRCV